MSRTWTYHAIATTLSRLWLGPGAVPMQEELPPAELARVLLVTRQAPLGLATVERRYGAGSRYLRTLKPLLQSAVHAAAGQGLLYRERLRAILQALAEAGIVVAPFKGPYLEEQLGLPFGTRSMGDFDLIITKTELAAATAALASLGFAPPVEPRRVAEFRRERFHQTPLIHPEWGTVELHLRFYPDLLAAAMTVVHSRRRRDRYLDLPVWQLEVHDLYAVLCLHFLLTHWTTSLKWAVDLLQFQRILLACHDPAFGVASLSPYLAGFNPAGVAQAAHLLGAAFFIRAAQTILAQLSGCPLPESATAPLAKLLAPREQAALRKLAAPGWRHLSPDWVILQARLARAQPARAQPDSGRHKPVDRTKLWRTLLPSAARIALETGADPDSRLFFLQRLFWLTARVRRGMHAFLGQPSTYYPASDRRIL